MYTLVLLRHGQSQWNLENRFTGWADPSLTALGEQEAHKAGQKLQEAGLQFDIVYTNLLKRCLKTTFIALEELNLLWVPVIKDWRLNERFYGGLTGLNKAEMAAKYGEEQVLIWRRSYDTRPPELPRDSEYFPGNDPKYLHLRPEQLPVSECLKDVVERMVPYFNEVIVPDIKVGKRVLISASGNSLRAIIKYLDNVPETEITELNVPTGIPLVYELDENLKPIRHYYLANAEELEAAVSTVKNQGKAK